MSNSRMDGMREWVGHMAIDQSTKTLCQAYVDALERMTEAKPDSPETDFQIMHGRLMLGIVARETMTSESVQKLLSQHKQECMGGMLISGDGSTKKATVFAMARAFGIPGAWIVTVIAFADPLNKLLLAVVEGLTGRQ